MTESVQQQPAGDQPTPPATSQPASAEAETPKRKPRAAAMVRLDFETDRGFELAQRRATALSVAGAVPEMFRGPPGSPGWGNTLIALELAHRLDYPPLLVMQNLTLVDGRPGWQGKFYIALVQSGNRFRDADWEWKGAIGSDEYGARMVATRISDGKKCVGQWVDVRLAKTEGWWSKKDRNGREWSKWPSMTAQMLVYRSASFWTNQWNPGATLGIRSADELEDVRDGPPQLVAPPPATKAAPTIDVTPAPAASAAGAQTEPTGGEGGTLDPGKDPPSMGPPAAAPLADPLADLRTVLAAKDWATAIGIVAKLPRGPARDAAAALYNQARQQR